MLCVASDARACRAQIRSLSNAKDVAALMHLCNWKWRHCCLNLQDARRAQGADLDGQETTYWLNSGLPLSVILFTNMCWCVFMHRGQRLWGEHLQWGQHLREWLSLLQTNWRFEDSLESIAVSHYDLLLNLLAIIWKIKYLNSKIFSNYKYLFYYLPFLSSNKVQVLRQVTETLMSNKNISDLLNIFSLPSWCI